MTNKHYDNAMKRLKENNVRITPQRQIILKYLIENDNHPTVETIFNVLDKTFPNLSMATVYNNLRLFKKLNLIIELPSVDSGYRYDFYDHPHLHAACDICNKIIDIDDPEFAEIEKNLKDKTRTVGFKPTVSSISIHGICKECQENLANQ
ncbi:Fur family transcriptional regulator [Fructilactobacillus sanfranciscensis]|uniref:Fur family transcriptional regulator n=1 Tax=Fructilactobacillus sanfranciscensis TaxID=1625 RepID=UPI0037567409